MKPPGKESREREKTDTDKPQLSTVRRLEW